MTQKKEGECSMTQKKENGNLRGNKKKKTLSRREFLQHAGWAAGGVALVAATSELWSAGVVQRAGVASPLATAANPQAPLPPHRAVSVAGTHAYADKLSVKPGETVNFYVSSDAESYTWRIFRLGPDPDKPISDQSDPNCDKAMSEELTVTTPPQQPI